MLGWTPATYDAHNALFNLIGTRDGTRGVFNNGGYSNPRFDTLTDQIAVETDARSRQAHDRRGDAPHATRSGTSRCTSSW